MESITPQVNPSTNPKDYVAKPKSLSYQKKEHTKEVWKYVGKIALLVWTILILVRVPFVGSYVDGLIDYVLGIGKYVLYALLIFAEIGWIFKLTYLRFIRSPKFIACAAVSLLCICCIISGVSNMIVSFDARPTFAELITRYHTNWLAYLQTWSYSNYFNSGCISGGILAELLSYVFNFLSYVVLIVVAAVILLISIFIIFNINYRSTRVGLKIRSWMIRKLGGSFKYDGYNELKSRRDNQNKFKKTKKIQVEATAIQNSCIPYDLLPDTDLNKYDANFRYARKLQNRLANLFKSRDIDCVPTELNIYSSFSEICFEAKNKDNVRAIIEAQPAIAKTIRLDYFNMSLRGNIVNIEVENQYFSKFSLKTVLNMYDEGKDVSAVFGLDKTNKLVWQNFRNSPSALIVGKKGSGAATLAVLIALSTCYITSPDDLELIVLNPNYEATFSYFNNLPHCAGKALESVTLCTNKLHEIQDMIVERNSLLKVNNVANIEQYNKTISNTQVKFKHVLILATNVDGIVRDSFQNSKIISDILINGPKAGVYLVLHSYVANNDLLDKEIVDNVSEKYILALANKEESMKIFNNQRGSQLHGNGDCLHYSGNKINSMERLQICNLNYTELTTDIDIIKTFYATKLRQKEAEIIKEDKDETNQEQ